MKENKSLPFPPMGRVRSRAASSQCGAAHRESLCMHGCGREADACACVQSRRMSCRVRSRSRLVPSQAFHTPAPQLGRSTRPRAGWALSRASSPARVHNLARITASAQRMQRGFLRGFRTAKTGVSGGFPRVSGGFRAVKGNSGGQKHGVPRQKCEEKPGELPTIIILKGEDPWCGVCGTAVATKTAHRTPAPASRILRRPRL